MAINTEYYIKMDCDLEIKHKPIQIDQEDQARETRKSKTTR